jgi:hypothetical protein
LRAQVGLGAGASFAVSCVAAALPGLGWRTFFEEPAMLLGEAQHAGLGGPLPAELGLWVAVLRGLLGGTRGQVQVRVGVR